MNKVIFRVLERIKLRSQASRIAYLERMQFQAKNYPPREGLSCGNLAHGIAACSSGDKQQLRMMNHANIAIVSAYNDVLSAHQPYQGYPEQIKQSLHSIGSTGQFAGGVPAMCDGVTQGQAGMDLSLFSRDVIAMSTAIAMSHNLFDGGLCLGICDKIVPGLLMGALSFGHLPFVFIPAGPMPSGLSNKEKHRVREAFAAGNANKEQLLDAELASYHSPGTCTFYGTANSNQLLMEVMGLHLPGASFVNPDSILREKLTDEAAKRVVKISSKGEESEGVPLHKIISAETIVNAMVALLATGGSTNHTMHLVAIAAQAGIQIDWTDFSELSASVPLLTRIYPNGEADINDFQAAGGMPVLFDSLLGLGLLSENVFTVMGKGLSAYLKTPVLAEAELVWQQQSHASQDLSVLSAASKPFESNGGLTLLEGNLGRAIMKTSALERQHRCVTAPAIIFDDQDAVLDAFENGELNKDCVVIVRFQGPRANGMPELHKLTPTLGVLQGKGYAVALVTDGRMSGASGKVPAAIQVWPEASRGGMLAKLQNGDQLCVDGNKGLLTVKLTAEELNKRKEIKQNSKKNHYGLGRELFSNFRQNVSHAEQGAMSVSTD